VHEVREHSLLYGGVCFVFKQSGGLIHRETRTNFVKARITGKEALIISRKKRLGFTGKNINLLEPEMAYMV